MGALLVKDTIIHAGSQNPEHLQRATCCLHIHNCKLAACSMILTAAVCEYHACMQTSSKPATTMRIYAMTGERSALEK